MNEIYDSLIGLSRRAAQLAGKNVTVKLVGSSSTVTNSYDLCGVLSRVEGTWDIDITDSVTNTKWTVPLANVAALGGQANL